MTAQNELDRALGAWFSDEALATPPAGPLARVIESTSSLRPRPTLAAGIGSGWVGVGSSSRGGTGIARLRPVVILALVALLVVALLEAAVLVGSQLLLPRHLPRSYVNEFVSAPDLPRPMAFPVLVPLVDGRVLVIGNEGDGGNQTMTAILYDPATGASVAAGPLVSPDRYNVAASTVRLTDGRLLIAGGGVIQFFDPATLQFAAVGPTVASPTSPTMALLHDGRVLIANGDDPDPATGLRSAELFDPGTLTFSSTGSLSQLPVGLTATLADGRVFVPSYPNAQVYDPTTGTFSEVGIMPAFPATAALVMPDGRVVIVGGWSLGYRGRAAIWDPTSQAFTSALDPRAFVTSGTLLDDGRILLIGRRDTGWAGTFDPATRATTEIKPPLAWQPTATRLTDGRVLIVGGLIDGKLRPTAGGSSAPGATTVEFFR
jgi:hypothetical protein